MNQGYMLERAIAIACEAHEGQTDKGGRPYILHPLHIMNRCLPNLELATIGVLHDVVEDSEWTVTDLLEEGMSNEAKRNKAMRQ